MNKKRLISIIMACVFVLEMVMSPISAKAGTNTTNSVWKDVRITQNNVVLGLKQNGELYSWGADANGSLNGHGEDALFPRLLMSNIESIEASCGYMAAIDKNGTLYMWGSSYNGALGEKSDGRLIRYPMKVMDNVKSVNFVEGMTAVIAKTGDLYVFGDNGNGRLGINSTESYIKTPTKVMSGVKEVAMTTMVTAALKKNGDLYTWGCYGYGALGQGKGVDSSPKPAKILSGISKINAGYNSMLAVAKNGKLYAWGSNAENEQLRKNTPDCVPSVVKTMGKVVSAQYMGSHSIGYINTKGDLYITGGMARINKNETRAYVKVLSNVASFAYDPSGGGSYTIGAVTKNGNLYTWGNNKDVGCLGNGTESGVIVKPKKIMRGVSKVVFGRYVGTGAGAAIKKDGSLWLWGSGAGCKQGNGSNENKTTPHKIITLREAVFPNMKVQRSGSLDKGLTVKIYPEGKGKGSIEYRCNKNPLPMNVSAEELGAWFTSQGYDLDTLVAKKYKIDGDEYVDVTASNDAGLYGTWTFKLTKKMKNAKLAGTNSRPHGGAIDTLKMIVDWFGDADDSLLDQSWGRDTESESILSNAFNRLKQLDDNGLELNADNSWNLAVTVLGDEAKQACKDKLTEGVPLWTKHVMEKIKGGLTDFASLWRKDKKDEYVFDLDN